MLDVQSHPGTLLLEDTRPRTRRFAPDRVARLETVMRRHLDRDQIPGLVLLVRHRDREAVLTMGTLAFDSDAPMRRDTLFRLASTTKPITAVGAMTLVEECRLRLDDPVDEWLPELRNRRVLRTIESPLEDTVPAVRPITVRDLLTFRSGYGEVGFLAPTCPLQQAISERQLPLSTWPFPGTPDEFMSRLGDLPLACQPGERWLYHMGLEILGVLIERITGLSLGAFLERRVFAPLGMKDTGFFVPEEKLDRLPTCYGRIYPSPELLVFDRARGGQYSRKPAFESGAGGLVSTADDLCAFGRMMLQKGSLGGERILSRATVELMTTDQVTADQKARSPFFENYWDARGWGFGMSVVTARGDIGESPGRFGWDGAYGTSCYVDPNEDLIGILLTQRRPDVLGMPRVIQDFWTSVYPLIDD